MNRKGSWGAVDVRATTQIMNADACLPSCTSNSLHPWLKLVTYAWTLPVHAPTPYYSYKCMDATSPYAHAYKSLSVSYTHGRYPSMGPAPRVKPVVPRMDATRTCPRLQAATA